MRRFKNSKGTVLYGMHMVPGVAEYQDPKSGAYRVFVNENTIRAMDKSFEGRPLFVAHVDGVDDDVDELSKETDGWVMESFYNKADGKHWTKFIITSKKAHAAVQQGYRLSNCYVATSFGPGGTWNGVSYQKEVKGGEYEHLALVSDPRYEESVVLTPEEFKKYNEQHLANLEKISNSKGKKMKLDFFKREKVTNSADLALMSVLLPKSNREITVEKMVNELDEYEVAKATPRELDMAAMVEVGDSKMTITELVAAYTSLAAKVAEIEDDLEEVVDEEIDEEFEEEEEFENSEDDDEDEEVIENADDTAEKEKAKAKKIADAAAKKKADALKNKKKNSADAEAIAKKKIARDKAERLKNAKNRVDGTGCEFCHFRIVVQETVDFVGISRHADDLRNTTGAVDELHGLASVELARLRRINLDGNCVEVQTKVESPEQRALCKLVIADSRRNRHNRCLSRSS